MTCPNDQSLNLKFNLIHYLPKIKPEEIFLPLLHRSLQHIQTKQKQIKQIQINQLTIINLQ